MPKRRGAPKTNRFAVALTTYRLIPKSVFAAVAYAFAARLGDDDPKSIEVAILDEWRRLHGAGVIPQKRFPRDAHIRQRDLFPQDQGANYGL